MENSISDEIKIVENFLSGSESGLIIYEYAKKEQETINIVDEYQTYSPMKILRSSIINKITKAIAANKIFNEQEFVIDGFNVVYNANLHSPSDVRTDPQAYFSIIPVQWDLEIVFNGVSHMIPQGSVAIVPPGNIEFGQDNNNDALPYICAEIDLLA